MTLRQLRKSKTELIEKVKALNAKESLTESENSELEKRWAEAKALDTRITVMEETEKSELEKQPIVPKKEQREYSLLNAINCLERGRKGYEAEVERELEKRTGRSANSGGMLIPLSALFPKPKLETRIVSDGQTALIDNQVREELQIKALYERSIAKLLGIKMITGMGDFRIPTSSKLSAGWVVGDGSDSLGDQDISVSSQDVKVHFLGGISGWSMKLLKESSGSVNLEQIVRENMLAGLAEKFDDGILNATGAGAQPSGFNHWYGSTSLKAKTVSDTMKWAYSDFTEQIKEFRDAYKNNQSNPRWLMGSADEKLLREIQRFTSSDGESVLDSIGDFVVSGHVPSDRLWLGQWDEFMCCLFDTAEISLGFLNDDFKKLVQRIRVVMCADFVGLRKEGFRGFAVTRS